MRNSCLQSRGAVSVFEPGLSRDKMQTTRDDAFGGTKGKLKVLYTVVYPSCLFLGVHKNYGSALRHMHARYMTAAMCNSIEGVERSPAARFSFRAARDLCWSCLAEEGPEGEETKRGGRCKTNNTRPSCNDNASADLVTNHSNMKPCVCCVCCACRGSRTMGHIIHSLGPGITAG